MNAPDYSEDYQHLLDYKKNMSKEATRAEAFFFFLKYFQLIDYFLRKFSEKINGTYTYSHKKMEYPAFAEIDLASDLNREERHFLAMVRCKYIPQALRNFNPAKIIKKDSYVFATHIYNYLRHALRDLRPKVRIDEECESIPSHEDGILEGIDRDRKIKRLNEIKKTLSPLESYILGYLAEEILKGSKKIKQKDIIARLVNPKTGKPFSKGYISKLMKKLRSTLKNIQDEE